MKFSRLIFFPNKSLFFLILYIVLSAIMMNFSEPAALSGIRWVLLQVSEKANAVVSYFSLQSDLEVQNEYLTKENFELRVRDQQLREMVLENARLKRMLGFRESEPGEYVAAQVIASGPEKNIGSVVIDVGEDDSVAVNMAVVNANGLVGKIFEVTSSQALVQLLKDRNAFVSARLQGSREIGTIAWTGSGIQLEMQHILKNIPVEEGEMVLTSGMGGVYPVGIQIGIVVSVKDDERGMFRKILVQPSVNFNALEEVFVVRKKQVETETD
ncbi:MAG: rod shape-determining protein MreC [Calditrichia bacterium]